MAGQFTVDRDGTEPDEAPFYLMLQGRYAITFTHHFNDHHPRQSHEHPITQPQVADPNREFGTVRAAEHCFSYHCRAGH